MMFVVEISTLYIYYKQLIITSQKAKKVCDKLKVFWHNSDGLETKIKFIKDFCSRTVRKRPI
jgi:uncharacterized lipoprotein YehR (DUF1307 family)